MAEEENNDQRDQDSQPRSYGQELLTDVWFSTIHQLDEIVCNAEDKSHRIEAARVLLEYYKSFGQSLNEPWIPDEPTDLGESDDEYDEDDD